MSGTNCGKEQHMLAKEVLEQGLLEMSGEDDSSDYDNDSTVDPDYIPDKDKISSTELNDDLNSDEEAESGIHPVSNDKELHGKTRDSPNVEINLPAVQKFPNVSDEDQLVDEEAISENEHVDEQENDEGVRPTVRHHKRTGAILTRKRRRDPSSWKCNIRKKLRQSGQEYVNSRGNVQESRSVKTKKDCSKCKFKCSYNISEADRKKVFDEFWTLDDNGKRHFFSRTTTQSSTKRPKVGQPSRRSMSLTYSLPVNGEHIRVCKIFYLSTLDINHKRVHGYHNTKQPTGHPENLKWGKAANNVVPEDTKVGIREHINSIPRVQSHYCRATTNKEYVAPDLNISLLHEKYVQKCIDSGKTPGKLHLYRQIFNTEFNIGFHMPKKDRCDTCEAMKHNKGASEEEKEAYQKHLTGKVETKAERDRDRTNKNSFNVCFDLQNVFALPTADVSNFFYKRKLNVYHMTAHCSADKKGYGAIWHEGENGRTGNDIASAVIKLLGAIVDENKDDVRVKNITLWSDSCVPQNRNSIFSTAVKVFLKHHPQVHTIEHKFCEPGHSSIQEVDNLHSQIESVCKHCELYSPVGLVRALKKVNRKRPMKIMLMKTTDFKDYGSIAQQGKYQRVPFTKVKSLFFEQNQPKILKYKTKFSDDWLVVNVIETRNTRQGIRNRVEFEVPDPQVAKANKPISDAKKADIKAMLKFMPLQDKVFMSNLVK